MATTLIKNGFVMTMDKDNRIIKKGAVAISGNKIVGVGKEDEVTKGFKADETIDANNGIIMPGFICNHSHTHAQAYMGGPEYPLGENPTFLEVLGRDWWPKLEDMLTREDVYHVAKYTSMLMMKWGFTYVFDVMEAPNSLPGVLDSEAKALEELGMRGTLVQEATERISDKNAELGIQENLKFAKKRNFEKDALETNRKELTYAILQRNVETNQKLYNTLLSKIKESDIVGTVDVSNIRIAEKAIVPQVPVKPRKKMNLILSVIVGLVTGVGLAFLLEYLDQSLRTEEDVQRYLDQTVLSVIPVADVAKQKGQKGPGQKC